MYKKHANFTNRGAGVTCIKAMDVHKSQILSSGTVGTLFIIYDPE